MSKPRRFELVPVNDCPFGDGAPFTDMGRQAAEYWHEHVATADDYDARREWFAVLFLDQERRLIGHIVLPPGGASFVEVDSAKIFRPAFASGAASIVCIHNHPGADVTASPQDFHLLREVIKAGRLLEIGVSDFVIVCDTGAWASMDDIGLFEKEREIFNERPVREDELAALFSALIAPAPELVCLICDAAYAAKEPAHDFLFALVRKFLKGHLTAEPGSDPKLALASQLWRMDRKDFLPVWHRKATDEGKSILDCIWDTGQSQLREFEAAPENNFTTSSAERVTAAGV